MSDTAETELAFDHDDQKRLYNYVERHGECTYDDLEAAMPLSPRGIRHHVAILQRDGFLRVDDEAVTVAFDADVAAETHRSDGIEVVVRPARQGDLSGLVGAIRQVADDRTYIEAESVADIVDHEEVLLRHNDVEERMFFVATVDEAVVGWVHLVGSELAKLAHTATLTVGVIDAHQGHGIGGYLLERGLEWAASRGYEKLYNSVPATNNAAIGFLESRGWEREARRADHYQLDEAYVDEVMMAYRL